MIDAGFRYHLAPRVRVSRSASVWAQGYQHNCGQGLTSGADFTALRCKRRKPLDDGDVKGASLLTTIVVVGCWPEGRLLDTAFFTDGICSGKFRDVP